MTYMTEANAIAAQLHGKTPPAPRGGSPVRTTPSRHQLQVLAYLREFFAENDQLPPYSAIAEKFGIGLTGAEWHVKALIRFGRLKRNAVGKLRFARPVGGVA